MRLFEYQDSATFVKVSSSGYSNNKSVEEQSDVSVVFIQSTGFNRSSFRDNVTADATCFPDPENTFILANHDRLEGMYILAPLFGINDDEGWYKVISVAVNRDHLLSNQIDNIELRLKKTRKIGGVS